MFTLLYLFLLAFLFLRPALYSCFCHTLQIYVGANLKAWRHQVYSF
nr:MAG TPA: hypothetical protein [Caudoviricetes sp.]